MNREQIRQFFDSDQPVIGMVHLEPLPGSPRYSGNMQTVLQAAEQDASTLAQGGVSALLIENFGDVPFYPERVPAETLAAMAAVSQHLRTRFSLPLGINVLRNDGYAAIAVAAATGAQFIRVNILSGAAVTDQGLIQGQAHAILRLRSALAAEVKIFADVLVKHASPLGAVEMTQQAAELIERSLADALICTGAMTGAAIDRQRLQDLRQAVPSAALIAGSGVDAGNIQEIFKSADAVIVGTSIKQQQIVTNRVDPERLRKLMAAIKS